MEITVTAEIVARSTDKGGLPGSFEAQLASLAGTATVLTSKIADENGPRFVFIGADGGGFWEMTRTYQLTLAGEPEPLPEIAPEPAFDDTIPVLTEIAPGEDEPPR